MEIFNQNMFFISSTQFVIPLLAPLSDQRDGVHHLNKLIKIENFVSLWQLKAINAHSGEAFLLIKIIA